MAMLIVFTLAACILNLGRNNPSINRNSNIHSQVESAKNTSTNMKVKRQLTGYLEDPNEYRKETCNLWNCMFHQFRWIRRVVLFRTDPLANEGRMANRSEEGQFAMLKQFLRTCSALCSTHKLTLEVQQKLLNELKNLDFPKSGLTLPPKGWLTVPVFSSEVFQNERISCVIFGFRNKGDALPLHDHPDMYGFIRVVRGQIQIDSYSWLNDETLEARAEPQVILEGQNVAVLGPSKGNVHQITALTDDAVFFDLLVPGYVDDNCDYYRVADGPNSDGLCNLESIDMNYDFMTAFTGNEIEEL
ncbi:hypothetical protein QR680_000570 [Steinernema hermaphroditum]|uniref:Cysteine dioxygenase n=1 Tax=Steinernema hermaphroditum TaxID=289476 RepID=A0AA39LEC0_9BILA|nr:hypothetical protein QR680_000570 [Steinernema hermaphroditum]